MSTFSFINIIILHSADSVCIFVSIFLNINKKLSIMEHDFKNLGISPLSSLDDRKVKVRIYRSLANDDFYELSLSQYDCNLTYLGRVCVENGLMLLVLGYGD